MAHTFGRIVNNLICFFIRLPRILALAPLGCADKLAKKYYWLICGERKTLFWLKKYAKKDDYKADEQDHYLHEHVEFRKKNRNDSNQLEYVPVAGLSSGIAGSSSSSGGTQWSLVSAVSNRVYLLLVEMGVNFAQYHGPTSYHWSRIKTLSSLYH